MTKNDIASAITPIVRHGLTVVAGFFAAKGLSGATDMVPDFTSAAVLLLATLAWSLVEKSKLLQALCAQVPLSSLEEVANTVSKLRGAGGDPLLIAHIAQAVTALANQELAAATPALVPQTAPAPQPVAVVDPPPPASDAPAVEAAPPVAAPVTPSSSPPDGASGAAAPVLADGSLPA